MPTRKRGIYSIPQIKIKLNFKLNFAIFDKLASCCRICLIRLPKKSKWFIIVLIMDFEGVKDLAIHGSACIVDVSCGTDDVLRVISAKEKYFDCKLDDGVLNVTQAKRNILYRIIKHRIELKIVLPKCFRGKLKLKNKNGGLYAKDGRFTELELFTKNGKFDIENVRCEQFVLKMKNGGISIKNLTSSGNAAIKCKNGTVKVETVSSKEFSMSCANASLTAIDISPQKFECSTKNGTIDASAIAASEVKIATSNGKINASPLGKRDDYKLSADTAHGIINVDGVAHRKIADVAPLNKKINVKAKNGDIDIRFV